MILTAFVIVSKIFRQKWQNIKQWVEETCRNTNAKTYMHCTGCGKH